MNQNQGNDDGFRGNEILLTTHWYRALSYSQHSHFLQMAVDIKLSSGIPECKHQCGHCEIGCLGMYYAAEKSNQKINKITLYIIY